MAPISCPQCHRDITISACPYCGFSFGEADELEETEHPRVFLGEPRRNLPFGIGFTVAGALGMSGSLFFILTSPLGILMLLASMMAIVLGTALIIGDIAAACPSCGKKIHLLPNAQSAICPHCRTICVRNQNYLEVL